jgi:predicted glutamine amidotransferase
MFGVIGSSFFASSLQQALISAAQYDDFRRDRDKRHDTGWGGVWFSQGEAQKFYRSGSAIFKDPNAPKFFEEKEGRNGPLVGLSHARLAAPDEPRRGALDSHPFSTHISDELVYVTHNGWINKTKIATKARVKNPSLLNDTEVFTYLLEHVDGDSLRERLEAAIEEVRKSGAMIGALNLVVLSITRDGRKQIYFHVDFPDKKKELYYSLYEIRENNHNAAVMSSTVAYKAGYVDETGKPKSNQVTKSQVGKVLNL